MCTSSEKVFLCRGFCDKWGLTKRGLSDASASADFPVVVNVNHPPAAVTSGCWDKLHFVHCQLLDFASDGQCEVQIRCPMA